MKQLSQMEAALGYTFQQRSLIEEALTHPSLGERNYQRLEFLGDAVLELCVSRLIFLSFPDLKEGEMTRLRAAMVREETLCEVGKEIGLHRCILMDRGCAMAKGKLNRSIVADVTEAVLAVVFLESGLDQVRDIVTRFWQKRLQTVDQVIDAKSALQEHLQANGMELPTYQLLRSWGPQHDLRFEVAVLIGETVFGTGIAAGKKQAEQLAAKSALEKIQAGMMA